MSEPKQSSLEQSLANLIDSQIKLAESISQQSKALSEMTETMCQLIDAMADDGIDDDESASATYLDGSPR